MIVIFYFSSGLLNLDDHPVLLLCCFFKKSADKR